MIRHKAVGAESPQSRSTNPQTAKALFGFSFVLSDSSFHRNTDEWTERGAKREGKCFKAKAGESFLEMRKKRKLPVKQTASDSLFVVELPAS